MSQEAFAPPDLATFDAVELPASRRRHIRDGLLPTLLVLFFGTGACGLIYQQLWVRLLSLVFGVTVYAVSTVLACFFAGLALGSYVAGRLVDRARRPLRWYGCVEILVGLAALATTAALSGVERVYVATTRFLPDSVGLLTGLRFVLAFAVLLVPATLMGASLPIVVRSALVRSRRLGERVSLLYATNTAGAIVGTLLAGFWLIGERGLTFSFRLAAAVNIGVGIFALLASRRWESRHAEAIEPDDPVPEPARPVRPSEQVLPEHRRRVVLGVFVISGFVSLGLEVVWFRVLVLYLESTTYAFTIMLATVLAGIALGSYLVGPVMRVRVDWLKVLAAVELVLSVVALTSLYFLSKSYAVTDRARDALSFFSSDLQPMLVASGLAILPTTLLFGFAFPIGVRLWSAAPTSAADESGRRVGVFYACNVAAGIAGSVVAGFVLVPKLGIRGSLVALAALLLASGLTALLVAAPPRTSFAVGGFTAAVFAIVTATLVPNPWAAALAYRYPGEQLLWEQEGPQATVSIHRLPDGSRNLYLDGMHQADTIAERVNYHRTIGSLPMAIHPNPERALVVGLGGGVTAGGTAAFGYPDVDIVELSDEVVQGSRFFTDVNGDVLHRPNVNVRVDDGRNYMLTTDKKYDVITADIILPETAGAANVWSVDYWRVARDALKDDGIMLQWIPTRSDTEYKLVMRSFLKVFPHATLWESGGMLIGSKHPVTLDRAAFARKLENQQARSALEAVGITGFDSLVARYTAGPDEMRAFVGAGPLLTDDRPRLEYARYLNLTPRPLNLSPLIAGTDPREILR
jgi:spermidine synthase